MQKLYQETDIGSIAISTMAQAEQNSTMMTHSRQI
jgi:hypothetical protein